jgi:hypothetical protein
MKQLILVACIAAPLGAQWLKQPSPDIPVGSKNPKHLNKEGMMAGPDERKQMDTTPACLHATPGTCRACVR